MRRILYVLTFNVFGERKGTVNHRPTGVLVGNKGRERVTCPRTESDCDDLL